ncbi:MAG: enoyl-CoA hydratase/isomerase family protein [Gammaproteobacteria bacterium]|nr:enoyl-CoA hydratase/isomerase family protein [Gammaproteobacteria bacterium]
MSADQLLISRKDGVLTLTINRPEKRNALKMDLLDEIGASLTNFADDENLKCAVITAAGDRCFAAGGDLKELDSIRSPDDAEAMSKRGRQALDQVRRFPLPVVAGLNGLAFGGGAELAMACDLRVAVPQAEIGFLQAQLNVTTAWGGGIDLIVAIGRQKALELLLSAKRLPADEAYHLGLIDRICAAGQDLDDCLREFLSPYLKRSGRVLRGFKALTAAYRRMAHEKLTAVEQEHFIASWTHVDHWDAVEKTMAGRSKK